MPCFAVRTVNDSACLGKRICVSSGDRTAHLPVCFRVQSAAELQGRAWSPGRNQGCFFFLSKSTYDAWIWKLSLIRKPDVQTLIGCEDSGEDLTGAVSEDRRGPVCSGVRRFHPDSAAMF